MKTYWYLVILALCIVACREEENRDTLEFRDHAELVEEQILEMEKMLVFIPNNPHTDSALLYFPYQNYHISEYKLYFNDVFVLDIENPNREILVKDYDLRAADADKFISIFKFLYENGIQAAHKACLRWGFIYKYSDERDTYRLIKVFY